MSAGFFAIKFRVERYKLPEFLPGFLTGCLMNKPNAYCMP
jgi:hypothetical protein